MQAAEVESGSMFGHLEVAPGPVCTEKHEQVDTSEAWIARAHERTLNHLREEVRVAELVTRLTRAPCLPPHEEVVREVHQLRAMVTSGAAFAPEASLPSQADGQMSAAEVQRALGILLHAFDSTRHSSFATRHLGRTTLRLRVHEDTYWQYRSRERLHRQHGPAGSFLRFLCFSLIRTWSHTLQTGVAGLAHRKRSRA